MMTIITSVPTVRKLFLIAFWGVSPETQVKVNFWTTCKNNEHLWSQHTVAPLKTIWHEPLYVAIEPLYVYLLGQALPIMVGIDPILDNRMWSDKNIRVGNSEETFWSELVSFWACELVSLWACGQAVTIAGISSWARAMLSRMLPWRPVWWDIRDSFHRVIQNLMTSLVFLSIHSLKSM